jgi:hypothetical protein
MVRIFQILGVRDVRLQTSSRAAREAAEWYQTSYSSWKVLKCERRGWGAGTDLSPSQRCGGGGCGDDDGGGGRGGGVHCGAASSRACCRCGRGEHSGHRKRSESRLGRRGWRGSSGGDGLLLLLLRRQRWRPLRRSWQPGLLPLQEERGRRAPREERRPARSARPARDQRRRRPAAAVWGLRWRRRRRWRCPLWRCLQPGLRPSKRGSGRSAGFWTFGSAAQEVGSSIMEGEVRAQARAAARSFQAGMERMSEESAVPASARTFTVFGGVWRYLDFFSAVQRATVTKDVAVRRGTAIDQGGVV